MMTFYDQTPQKLLNSIFKAFNFKFILIYLVIFAFNSQNAFSQCYCTPTVNNSGGFSIGIQNVTLSTSDGSSSINNTTVATGNAPHYYDYTNLVVSGYAGDLVTGSVTNGSGNSTLIYIYVDWNQDCVFGTSAPELVWTSNNITANALVPVSFQIPQGQSAGTYRIRVEGDFGGGNYAPSPCQNNYGEFEDYTLEVISGDDPIVSFFTYDTIWTNSPTIIYNASLSIKDFEWHIDNNLVSTDFDLNLNLSSPALITITLYGLDGSTIIDQHSKDVVVANPYRAPAPEFIADNRYIARGESSNFKNFTDYGANSHQWSVIPEEINILGINFSSVNFIEGTNSSSINPVMRFPWPGEFGIQLKSQNAFGEDSIIKESYIYVGYTMCPEVAPDFTSSNEHKGLLFDDRALQPHGENQNCNFSIELCADTIYLIMEEFELQCGSGFLRIYDGNNSSGIPLYCENTNGFTGGGKFSCAQECLPPDTLMAFSGNVYVEYVTASNATNAEGFRMRWYSRPKTQPPFVDFLVQDTVCINTLVSFENLSKSAGMSSVRWDFNGDGNTQSTNFNGNTAYNTAGTYNVRLIVEEICLGTADTAYKTVVAVNPASIAQVEVRPSATKALPGEIVHLESIVTADCIGGYQWVINPSSNIEYMYGTNNNSAHPYVRFKEPGCYYVELRIFNTRGIGYSINNCLIEIINYCTPTVNEVNSDIGISRVKFYDIDNRTVQGQTAYSDFTHLGITDIEKGQTYTITVERNSNNNFMNRAIWIDYNLDGDFDMTTELVAFQSSTKDKIWQTSFTVPSNVDLGETRLRIGTSFGSHYNRPCGKNLIGEYHDYRVRIIEDQTAPVITLTDGDVYLEVFDTYIEPGYSAWDDNDGNITNNVVVDMSELDNTILGSYNIYYSVSDQAGNSTTAVRIVHVIDTQEPAIELNGSDTITIEVHTAFIDQGVTISDNYWTNIEPDIITNLDIHTTGTYQITYCATDGSGNGPVCVTRVVIVVNTTPPDVELIGGDTVFVDVLTNFNDPGIIATDNYWSDESLDISISGTFENTNELGTYSRIYTVTDGDGNTTVITRIIIVVDRIPPVITLLGDRFMNVNQWSEFDDPWIVVSDNFDPEPEIFTGGTFTNTQQTGFFTRTYYAVDNSGNVSDTVSRYIYVVNSTTSIEEQIAGSGVNIYPNPANNYFILHFENETQIQNSSITLTDVKGRQILDIQNPENTSQTNFIEVDISGLRSGVYIVNIVNKDFNTSKQLIIK